MAEKKYIERGALLAEDFTDSFVDWYDVAIFEHIIETAPTADVVEVVHGEWVWDDNAIDWGLGAWVCSECRMKNNNIGAGKPGFDRSIGRSPYAWAGSYYCPHCGAKMDGERKEHQ